MKSRKPPSQSGAWIARMAAGMLLLPCWAGAIHFPDTTALLKDYRLAARDKQGKPADFYRRAEGDSTSLHLEWKGRSPVLARYEQSGDFDPDSFSVKVSEYGEGGSWHELAVGPSDAVLRKLHPGIQQQWLLKGYDGETGWVGSGVFRGRYFLAFRESAPAALTPSAGPLRFGPGLLSTLDTSSLWLHVPCRDTLKGSKPVCFSPGDDARLRIRIERKSPLVLDIWLEEEASASLQGIRKALESVPDGSQSEYAKDLSQMLLGESQMFLVKLSQRLPNLFSWPSWQLQDFRDGRIPAQDFRNLASRAQGPGDSLPAFRYARKGSLRLDVDLFFRGTLHLRAEELR